MKLLRRLYKHRLLRLMAMGLAVLALVYALLPDAGLYPEGFRFSRTLLDRDGQLVHLALTADGKYRRHVPLAEISPLLIEATLELEDRHFHEHPGVNPLSLLGGGQRLSSWRWIDDHDATGTPASWPAHAFRLGEGGADLPCDSDGASS
jgi:membrane peptidoglycan carboxypeptidase